MLRQAAAALAVIFFVNSVLPSPVMAQALQAVLPMPGAQVDLSLKYVPALLRGVTIDPSNPFKFDFIVDNGNSALTGDGLQDESQRLVDYFLAAMTVPQKDLWVNLSPIEKDRIVPDALGKTELGQDLLAQDYILKQLASTLMYPEGDLGKKFWDKVYKEAKDKYGVTDIPTDTFNKVWIMPETATVYEHGATVYVVDAKLKVMLDRDYQAQQALGSQDQSGVNTDAAKIMKEIILPAIEQEVNTGKNFAPVRQIYYSLILAKWYKEKVRNSILSGKFVDQNKVAGIDLAAPDASERIYARYVEAYKKGVYNYIKEEVDQATGETVPRKYFSGGFIDKGLSFKPGTAAGAAGATVGRNFRLGVNIAPSRTADESLGGEPGTIDGAMITEFIKPAQLIMDWLAQRDKIPADVDLVWLFGTKAARQAYETADFLKTNQLPVLITGGIGKGKNAVTFKDAIQNSGLDRKAIAVIDQLLDNSTRARIIQKFNIDPNDPGSLENLDKLLDHTTRLSANIPEAMMYWAVLRSKGIAQDRIMVEAMSSTTGENIIFGTRVLGSIKPRKIIAVQESAMERRAAASLQQGLGADVKVYARAPFVFKGNNAIAKLSPKEIKARKDRAIKEIEKIREEFAGKIRIPAGVKLAYAALKRLTRKETKISETPDVKTVIDWLSEQEKLPADYGLLWLMGSKFPKPAISVAALWKAQVRQKRSVKVLVTGGVGRETETINFSRKNLGLSRKAVAQLDAILDNLSVDQIMKKFNIRRGDDMRKHEQGLIKDDYLKDWIRFYKDPLRKENRLPEAILSQVVDYDPVTRKYTRGGVEISQSEAKAPNARYIEELVIERLKNRKTRYKTVIPEGLVYYAILRSEGVPDEAIKVDAQSTNSVENIINGQKILGKRAIKSVVLVQEPYIQKRGKASFDQEPSVKGKYAVTSYAAFKYEELNDPAKLSEREFQLFRKNALSEIDKLITYPSIGKTVPVRIPARVMAAYQRLGGNKFPAANVQRANYQQFLADQKALREFNGDPEEFAELQGWVEQNQRELRVLEQNLKLVLADTFIKDIRQRIINFKKSGMPEPEAVKVADGLMQGNSSLARALAIEIERRLVSRDGLIMYMRPVNDAVAKEKFKDNIDRYNRIVEGVAQLLTSGDYGRESIFVNSWTFSSEQFKAVQQKGKHQFTQLFFGDFLTQAQVNVRKLDLSTIQDDRLKAVLEKIRDVANISDLSDDDLVKDYIKPLVDLHGLNLVGDLQEKFFLYSAPPGAGKGTIMKVTFQGETNKAGKYVKAPYEDIVKKYVLIHSRKARLHEQEVNGISYHFWSKEKIEAMAKEKDPKIAMVLVNGSPQGIVLRTFSEKVVLDLTSPTEKVLPEMDSDVVKSPDGKKATVTRTYKGILDVFKEDSLYFVEGGYAWMQFLKEKYPSISLGFISPFSEQEMQNRATMEAWLEQTYGQDHPENIRKAYEVLGEMIKERNAEVTLTDAVKAEIVKKVSDRAQDASENSEVARMNEQVAFMIKFGQYKQAEEILLKALELAPQDEPTLRNLGFIYSNSSVLQDDQKAFQYLMAATKADPNSAGAWGNLGEFLQRVGNHKQAQICFLRSIQLGLVTETTLYNLAGTYLAQRNGVDAERHLRKALELAPNDVGILSLLKTALVFQKKFNEALDVLLKIEALAPDSLEVMDYNDIASLLVHKGNFGDHRAFATAERYLLKATAIDPQNVMVLRNLGYVYQLQQKWAASLTTYEKSLTIDARDPQIQLNMAEVRKQLQKIAGDNGQVADASEVGGIDMNDINVKSQGSGVNVNFDPAMVESVLKNGVDGFVPVIISISPMESVLPVLGIANPV